MTIGDNIKRIRESRNMTQQELANYIGISRSYLGDLEKNRRNPSAETIKRISTKLDVSMVYLLEGTPTLVDKIPSNERITFDEKLENTIVNDTVLRLNNLNLENIDRKSLVNLYHYLGLLDYLHSNVSDAGVPLTNVLLEIIEESDNALSYINTLLSDDNAEDFKLGFKNMTNHLNVLKTYPAILADHVTQLENQMNELKTNFSKKNS